MIITTHTTNGITQHEATPQELEDLAADGDAQARIEVARGEMPAHSDPHKKINLLSWVIGLLDTRPQM